MLTPVTRLSEDALFTWCKPRLGTRRWLRLDVTCMRGRQTVRLAISPCEHQKLSTMGASLLYARSSIIRKRAAGIAAAMRCPICGELKRASQLWATRIGQAIFSSRQKVHLELWSLDFVSDALAWGRRIRLLCVI